VENNITKIEDGFDTWSDEVEDDTELRTSAIKGRRIKFNDSVWTVGKEPLPKGTRKVAIDVKRVVLKWPTDGSAPQTRFLEPGEKFPNTKKLNEETPRSEWRKGHNGLEGPWMNQHVLHLIDQISMDEFSYPASTDGGHRAVAELVDRTELKRRFCGPGACPIVEFGDTFMPTKYGGRQRPFFNIVGWVSLTGGNALSTTVLPEIEGPKTEPEADDNTTKF
jgi:hypothetical protein